MPAKMGEGSCCFVTQLCPILVTPCIVAFQSPLSMEFPRQEYKSELQFHSPGDLPNTGIKIASPALQADSLPLSHQESPVQSFPESHF